MSMKGQALVMAGAFAMIGMIGCSNDRTHVRRETEIIRNQPAAVQPPPETTTIHRESTYEHTEEK
jgi:hypothetical protein